MTPKFILAADHRIPFRRFDASRVRRFKQLLVEGLRLAAVKDSGLLLDEEFGSEAIADAREKGIPCGQPLEVTGKVPLDFLPGGPAAVAKARPAFAKVLVRGPDGELPHAAKLIESALGVLSAAGIPLVVELVFDGEDEDPAEESAEWLEQWPPGARPTHWKLYGHRDPRVLERLVKAAPSGSRFWILGGGEGIGTLRTWFAAASKFEAFQGFAVGRSIFWEPFMNWIDGKADDATTARAICARYLRVRESWP